MSAPRWVSHHSPELAVDDTTVKMASIGGRIIFLRMMTYHARRHTTAEKNYCRVSAINLVKEIFDYMAAEWCSVAESREAKSYKLFVRAGLTQKVCRPQQRTQLKHGCDVHRSVVCTVTV